LIYVLVGVFLGWLLAFVLILYISPSLIGYFGPMEVLPNGYNYSSEIFAFGFGGGMADWLSPRFLGSFVSISRLSKKKA